MNLLVPWIQPFYADADTRWRTPWGFSLPVVSFGIIVVIYAVLDDMAPRLYADPPPNLLPVLPIWPQFSFTLAYFATIVGVVPLILYRHYWFLRSAVPENHGRAVVTMAPLGFCLGVTVGSIFFLAVWYVTDGEAGRFGTGSDLWDKAFYFSFAVLATAIIGPAMEEVLFRVLLYGSIRRRASARTSILLTSALFSIAHGLAPEAVSTLILGLVTSTVYERTRSFSFCVAMHAGSNLAVLLFRLWFYRYGGP